MEVVVDVDVAVDDDEVEKVRFRPPNYFVGVVFGVSRNTHPRHEFNPTKAMYIGQSSHQIQYPFFITLHEENTKQ